MCFQFFVEDLTIHEYLYFFSDDYETEPQDDLDEYELDDLPPNASIHAADEVKKKLEEIDPCEKLRSLCKKGEVDLLEEFLSKKEETGVDIDYVSGDGWTCLHEIITHGCQFVGIAKTLLKHGAEVNTKDFNQDTPIHASLLYHNTENTRILVDHGADLSIKNGIGRTPLHNANDSESLEILLNAGADINAKDQNGNTVLHYAVLAKDVDRVKLLVTRKCDINAANNSGSTPLHLAADPDIVRILLDGIPEDNIEAAVNNVDNGGNSPLHIAVKGRHRDTVRLLVAKKSRHDLMNFSKRSPMSFAKDKEMKNILLKKTTILPGTPSGITASSSKRKPIKQQPTCNFPEDQPIVLPGNPELKSPSILKRKRHECINGVDIRRGPRLTFSEVNDYSGVEELPPVSKRVRAAPLYTEPQFSSDSEDD